MRSAKNYLEYNSRKKKMTNLEELEWKPIFERIVLQIFYRQLGMVSVPCPIAKSAEAIDLLCKEGYGNWRWLLDNRILIWENIPIDHAAKVHAYVFGSMKRQENSVIIRQGFWKMYIAEGILSTLNISILGRILARI